MRKKKTYSLSDTTTNNTGIFLFKNILYNLKPSRHYNWWSRGWCVEIAKHPRIIYVDMWCQWCQHFRYQQPAFFKRLRCQFGDMMLTISNSFLCRRPGFFKRLQCEFEEKVKFARIYSIWESNDSFTFVNYSNNIKIFHKTEHQSVHVWGCPFALNKSDKK